MADVLKKQRAQIKGSITRIEKYVITNENNLGIDVNEFVTREIYLQKLYDEYCVIQDKLIQIDESESNDMELVESKYLSTWAKLKVIIQKLSTSNINHMGTNLQQSPVSQNVSTGNQNNTRLPNIKTPIFSGKIEDWQTFFDLFKAVIDNNNSLDDVQKFLYLKGALSGEALHLINDLPLTNSNYGNALNLLSKRYDNKLVVINAHLKGMLDTPPLTKGSGKQLRTFLTHVRQHLNSLKAHNLPVKEWDVLLIFLFTQKLDFQTHRAYELEKNVGLSSTGLPTVDEFLDFLEKRCVAFENVEMESFRAANSGTKEKYIKPSLFSQDSTNNSSNHEVKLKCVFCNRENHNIVKCFKFNGLSVSERRQFVQDNRLCYLCFGKTHSAQQCKGKVCKNCNRRHHFLLHDEGNNNKQKLNSYGHGVNQDKGTTSSNNESVSQNMGSENGTQCQNTLLGVPANQDVSNKNRQFETQQNAVAFSKIPSKCILLATAMVNVITENGNKIQARALLDSGSQTCFITNKLLQKLKNVNCYTETFKIGGIANNVTQVNKFINLVIESRVNNYYKIDAKCAILNNITCQLPQVFIDTSKIKIPEKIKLADPFYFEPSEIDMLISADLYFSLILSDIVRLGPGLPVLQSTKLGWLVCGSAPVASNNSQNSNNAFISENFMNVNLFCQSTDLNVDKIIPKFWQLEEVTSQKFISADDKLCEKIFLESHRRLEDGSFQVDLPMRKQDDHLKLGNSFDSAYKRFKYLEKRFSKNPNLFLQYKDFINEYINMDHGKYLESGVNENQHRVFLAHHCVIRDEALTTKLRVVFDGSNKTSSGFSLNDIMLKGSPVQPELFDILCRFRTFQFVLVTDIKKMYRMIKVNPNHRNLQNILWRENPNDDLKIIELQTVTYGTNSAPFLATRCLTQLATDELLNYPLASKAILNQCYVDDILCGANTKSQAIKLREQLIKLLNSGGFSLHKWGSNDVTLVNSLDNTHIKNKIDLYHKDISSKVLGVVWFPLEDKFKVSYPGIEINESGISKRLILSKIAQIFDPLGHIGPVVLVAKILMQEIWATKLGWDEELPLSIKNKWKTFSNNLYHLASLNIPRCIFTSSSTIEIQIHGFSDASMSAYGACVYVRAIYADNSVSCNLVCSKSRIAPLKTVSLPRLELCGALLLSRLIHKIVAIIDIKINNVYLWTDSSIVLSWLNSSPNRWTTFVANRVSEIQELTTNCDWKHIKSNENPADFISRGMSSEDILSNELWWHGPQFLLDKKVSFSKIKHPTVDVLPEQRQVVLTQIINQSLIDWSRFSNFTKLQRTMAYVLKFLSNKKSDSKRLTVQELKYAEQKIIQLIQNENFGREIAYLQNNKNNEIQSVFKDSNLRSLNPFLDNSGILRVNGRLSKADINYNQKFPIILPAKNYVVRLLIKLEHIKLFHAGAQAVLANLRLKYWPIHGMMEVKSVLKSCITCFKFKAKTSTQLMGSLPLDRVSIARPFLKLGIDFGGPFVIKQSRLRGSTTTKAYIALFICMVTKAVHIEVVSSLSTDAFINTLKRFIARRGCPNTIYSDNGTNFQGANNLLKEIRLFFESRKNLDKIDAFLLKQEINWQFIPPASPHWGGLWEAGIKSAKYHLRRIMGNKIFCFEEMITVVAQIEAILNSRPLCPISSDSSDLSCLTPGHFLIGESLTALPEKDVSNTPENRLNFWQLCTKVKQNFWKRWSVEYLSRLQNRPKWFSQESNLRENMVVLLKEDNLPPLKWSLARIIEVMPGADKKVRMAKIKTKDGIYIRPITKLCPLPFENENKN